MSKEENIILIGILLVIILITGFLVGFGIIGIFKSSDIIHEFDGVEGSNELIDGARKRKKRSIATIIIGFALFIGAIIFIGGKLYG